MYRLIRRFASTKHEEWRDARVKLFLDLVAPAPGARVLDLGGMDGAFMARVCDRVDLNVTVADIDEQGLARASDRGFHSVRIEECGDLPFGDGEFDVVICNSVIEHVTIPKVRCIGERFSNADWIEVASAGQRFFANELVRVAKRYFVQTPHRHFPIEAHTWLPFVGWLPHQPLVDLVRITDRVWVKHCGYVDWNLLDEADMSRLFPAARIHVERLLGFPKSIIAYSPVSSQL
jgi:SAM-dependent methyltransferase